ncbi:glyoxalase [Nocardioides pacificus]
MSLIDSLTLEVSDLPAAQDFYAALLGADAPVRLRAGDAPTDGFRGFTLSLTVAQPADADLHLETAIGAGATVLKPAARSFWGYGGVVRAPDGTIWQVATSTKKNTAPPSRRVDDVVLLIGAEDVAVSKRFYVERGLTVAKSYGRKYVEFSTPGSPVTLALNGRRALAKVAGVPVEGSGSHRIAIAGEGGPFTDPDGFTWEAAAVSDDATDRAHATDQAHEGDTTR